MDASHAGTSDGSALNPWKTINEAIEAAAPGAIVAVAAGSYAQTAMVLGKPVRIWGRCPAMVEVSGLPAILIDTAPASEAHQLALAGPTSGVAVFDSAQVVLDALWIHDGNSPGVVLQGGRSETVLRGSLIDGQTVLSVYVEDGMLRIEESEIPTRAWTWTAHAAAPSSFTTRCLPLRAWCASMARTFTTTARRASWPSAARSTSRRRSSAIIRPATSSSAGASA